MTSPDSGLGPRIARASQAMGGGRPGTSLALAQSGLTDSELDQVGGFINGLGTTLVAKMARASGTRMDFTPAERDAMEALGEDYLDVDQDVVEGKDDGRSLIERAWGVAADALEDLGTKAVEVAEPLFDVMDMGLDVVKLPYRMLSSGLDPDNDDEIAAQMEAQGYDPDSTKSTIAFYYSQGDSLYHDLDHLRDLYGDDLIDVALEFFADPEAFAKRQLEDPAFAARVQPILNDPEFAEAADRVDRAHISPGRDVARMLLAGEAENGALFTAVSGVFDAVYTIALDPTLVIGKGIRLARGIEAVTGDIHGGMRFGAARGLARMIDYSTKGKYRAGIRHTRDEDGLLELLSEQTVIGRDAQKFLERANRLKELHQAKKVDEAGRLYDLMRREHAGWMPLLEEVQGTRQAVRELSEGEVVDDMLIDVNDRAWLARSNQDGIKTLEDFREFLVSTNGLLRLGNGWAAQTNLILPGRISLKARIGTMLREKMPVFDHTKFGQNVPDKGEAAAHAALDEIEARTDLTPQQKGDLVRALLRTGTTEDGGGKVLGAKGQALLRGPMAVARKFRAKNDQRARRLATLLPTVQALDLHSGAHAEQVRRFARIYLSRAEADRLAAMWVNGTAAERRAIARGMLEQTYHASGLATSPQGREFWEKFRGDQLELERQQYGYDGTDVIKTERGDLHVALYPSQLNRYVLLPSFREMQYAASKMSTASWLQRNVGARFYSPTTDSAMTAIKMGWITTPAGGFRNAIDEWAGVALRGFTGDQVKYRHIYTEVTRDGRAELLAESKRIKRMIDELGEEGARKKLAQEVLSGGAKKAAMLETRIRHRIPMAFRGMADRVNDVIFGELLGRLLSVRGRLNEKDFTYTRELVELRKQGLTNAVIGDTFLYADEMAGMTDRAGAKALARDGIMSAPIRWKKIGYENVEIDGGAGIDDWAAQLRIRFEDPLSPARVALKALWEAATPAGISMAGIKAAQRAVEEHMRDPRMRWFLDNAEVTNHTAKGQRISDPFQQGETIPAYAERIVADVKHAVTGRGGDGWEPELFDEVREWLGTLPRGNRRPSDWNPARGEEALAVIQRDIDTSQMDLQFLRDDLDEATAAGDEARVRDTRAKLAATEERIDKRIAEADKLRAKIAAALENNTKGRPAKPYTGRITDKQVRAYLKTQGIQPAEGTYLNGRMDGELVEKLLAGEIPDRAFLAKLPEELKPRYAYKEQFAPIMPEGRIDRMSADWASFLGKAYKKVVTDQVQAIVRNPLFASKYVTARKHVEPYEEHLKEQGFSPESAREIAKRIALGHAEQEVLKHIDNPTVATQFSVLARNFWAFERAQEDWLRRWGRVIRDDPTVIRKVQLGIHAGTASGVLQQDSDGHLVFTYPGSGAMVEALTKIGAFIGWTDTVQIPQVPDLSSRVTFVNPSLDNPLGFSATPIISVPFRFLAGMFGADYPMLTSAMDRVINGELGAGREVWETLLPTPIMRITNGMIREDPGSSYGQAVMQTIAQMEAAGALDNLTGNDPAKVQEFYDTVKAQTRSNMFAWALFALWAPAAPGVPVGVVDPDVPKTELLSREDFDTQLEYDNWLERQAEKGDVDQADWVYHQLGLASLKEEARRILNELPFGEAMAWWVKHHPGEEIFVAGSTSKIGELSQGATANATLAAAIWMEQNQEFLRKFPGIGTYFLPQGEKGTDLGEFSEVAYQSQLEQGIRERKDLREFLNDVIVRRGERIYYATKADYDEAIEQAEAFGDINQVRQLEDEWSNQKQLIYALNPLLKAKNAAYAENEAYRDQQVRDLVRLMQDPRSYKAIGQQADGVQQLIDNYQQYQGQLLGVYGQRGRRATRIRAEARTAYRSRMDAIVSEFPGLEDLASGVFRFPS